MNIFDCLTEKEKKLVKVFRYKTKEIIYHEDEACNVISLVKSGSVRIRNFTFDGEEIIYNRINENEMFGNNLVFSDYPVYKGDVVCEEDTVIETLLRDDLLLILQSNRKFLLQFLKLESNFAKSLNSRIKLLSFSSAEDRIMFYLRENNGACVFNSITDLAKMLNLKRETVSRTLSCMVKNKVIFRKGNLIKIK